MFGLKSSLQDSLANRYVDILPGTSPPSLDVEAQSLLHDLKHHKLPQALKQHSNFRSYSIPWVPGGVSGQGIEHREYLEQLCEHVLIDVKCLIKKAVIARSTLNTPLHAEVLHHATLCVNKCNMYCDRRDGVVEKIQQYVQSSALHPLVLHGKSGSGKTSVMAIAAKQMQGWISGESFVIVRFLGTSPLSTTIREVLISISEQVSSISNLTPPVFSKMDTIDITQYFRNELLISFGKLPNKSLVIMLDSIDQLSPIEGAHSMKWLPFHLPLNVKIIISMLDDRYDCFEVIQFKLSGGNESCLELGPLAIKAGMQIMDLWLSKIGRTITEEQRAIVTKAFLSCPQPLLLKLLFGQARSWTSYKESDSIVVFGSIQEALVQFYDKLETQFGKVLVQRSLGYFSAAKSGLTEAELEDVLSLDDNVLNDIYQYWDPPVEGIVRIPSLLWKRIRHFIDDYVVEQQADGMTVLVWYHRQFNESAKSRYVQGENVRDSLHFVLSEFFEGTWGNGVGKSVQLEHRNLNLVDANRQVPSQPLKFGQALYNYRKLSEFPYHLLHSNQISKLSSIVLCNFSWIHTKLKAIGFASLIQDYISTLKLHGDEKDISLVCETLSLSGSILKTDPDFLAGQLLGRLLSIASFSSNELLQEASAWVKESDRCIIQPVNSCLISPGGELKVTIAGHPQVILGVGVSTSLPLLVSYSKGSGCDIFNVWDLTSLECIENISTLKLHGKSLEAFNYVVTCNYLVAINVNSCILWSIKTGDCIKHIERFAGDEPLTCLVATDDCQCIVIGTKTGQVYFTNMFSSSQECMKLKFDNEIKSVHLTLDEKLILIMSGEDHIVIVDNLSKSVINSTTFSFADFSVVHVATSDDGVAYFLAGTTLGSICFLHIPTLCFDVAKGHKKTVKCLTHISSLNLVITGSLDKTIIVWDIKTHSIIRKLEGHMDGVWCLDSVPNTCKVVSGSKDDYLKVWDVLSGECLHTLEGHSSWISCVKALSPDTLVSGSNDKYLKFWKLKCEVSRDLSSRHLAQPECIALHGHELAASGGPDAVKIWNPLHGQCLFSLPTSASCLLFTRNGKNLIAGTKSGVITVYNCLDNFTQIKMVKEHKDRVTSLLWLREGSEFILLSSSWDSTLIVWSSSYKPSLLSGHTAGVSCIASCQDKPVVASGSLNGGICLWDLSLLSCIGTLNGHSKAVNCIAFSGNSARVITGSDDRTARVWSTIDRSCMSIIHFSDNVKVLCVVGDNIFIAGVHCSHKQLESWHMETGESLNDFVGHTHAVMCMLVIDEDHVLTGSRDGTVRVWNSKTAQMISSFDLQSQVKHISLSKTPDGCYLVAATTKSGPISFLLFRISSLKED